MNSVQSCQLLQVTNGRGNSPTQIIDCKISEHKVFKIRLLFSTSLSDKQTTKSFHISNRIRDCATQVIFHQRP